MTRIWLTKVGQLWTDMVRKNLRGGGIDGLFFRDYFLDFEGRFEDTTRLRGQWSDTVLTPLNCFNCFLPIDGPQLF